MLNVTKQGNANQRHNEILLHPCQDGNYLKNKKDERWQWYEEIGTLAHLVGMQNGVATIEQSGGSSKN